MTDPYSSINLIGSTLAERGYEMHKVRIDGEPHRQYQHGTKIWLTLSSYVRYPFISQTVWLLSLHKDIANAYVQSLGLAVPETTLVRQQDELTLTTAGKIKPVVVKPSDGAGSVGVTRHITDDVTLQRVVRAIWDSGRAALVQQQFQGEEIRITVIGDQTRVFWRQSARVVGDGVSTIRQLIDDENAKRITLQHRYITYPQLDESLITREINQSEVPAVAETVLLSDSTLISGGSSAIPIDSEIDLSYLGIAQKIANGLRAPFLVVDLLVHDFHERATADNYVFLECNTAPSIKLYYSLRTGDEFDILEKLVDMIDAAL